MKIIFKDTGVMWIIDRSETEPDVAGCTNIIIPNTFNPIASESEGVTTFKTLSEVQLEIAP
tara:strand:+ start:130 stop:312 length:183 start_codon:yes stop_codon:yes gene_type:complete